MANSKKATVNTETTKEATTMKKAKAVAPKIEEKKVDTQKVEAKAPAKKEEKKVDAKKEAKSTEKKNVNKLNITIQDVEKMLTDAKVGFKPNNCEYRILTSGSSLHVKKSAFVFYTTDDDFKKVSSVKAEDLELKEKGNAQDGKRPNYIRFTTEDTLKKVISALAVNVAVA